MSDPQPRTRWIPVSAIVFVAAVVIGALADHANGNPSYFVVTDFPQYWAAGRLIATGENPYDSERLLAIERTAGWLEDAPVAMWSPPWSLGLFAPLGWMPFQTAHIVWVAVQAALIAGSSVWVWRSYRGPSEREWLAVVLAAGPLTTGLTLVNAQSSGWLLFGLAGFLAAVVPNRPPLAALAVFCALKPHLFAPLWIVLALDASRNRAGAVRLLWMAAAVVVAAILPLTLDPDVWRHYLEALDRPQSATHRPLSIWAVPVLGYWLRMAIDPWSMWVQFVPVALAAAVTPFYWWHRRANWDWANELPGLVIFGAIAAPYGAWPTDLVILYVPIVGAAIRLVRAGRVIPWVVAAVGYAAVQVWFFIPSRGEDFVWVTPVVAVGCSLAGRVRGCEPREQL